MGKRLGRHNAHGVVRLLHLASNLDKLGADGFQVLGNHVLDCHIPFRHSSGKHESPRLNLVGNNHVLRTVKPRNSFYSDNNGSGAFNHRAHTV